MSSAFASRNDRVGGLNQWLTLAGNLGVLVGLFFLVVELNQANRIAAYTAENG